MSNKNKILLAAAVLPAVTDWNLTAIRNIGTFLSQSDSNENVFRPYMQVLDDSFAVKGFVDGRLSLEQLNQIKQAVKYASRHVTANAKGLESIVVCDNMDTLEQIGRKTIYAKGKAVAVTIDVNTNCCVNLHLSSEQMIETQTPAGILKSYVSNVPDYPGIYTTLTPNGCGETTEEIDLVSAGIDLHDNKDNTDIRLLMYEDPSTEDYTHKAILHLDDVKKALGAD